MKEKNDFKPKKVVNELAQPRSCLHCGHKELEQVEFVPRMSHLIKRLAVVTRWYSWPTPRYPLYGWRCMECGYVMWFTARYLD